MNACRAGAIRAVTSAAWSVNRNVVLSLTWTVKADMSVPAALNAASALSVEAGMAGKTTAFAATRSWHSCEPVNSTHFTAGAWFFVAAFTESAKPLNIDARDPLGPIGVGAIFRF